MFIAQAFAHELEAVGSQVQTSLEETIRSNSVNFTFIALGVIALLVILAIFFKEKNQVFKKILFGSFIVVILLNTMYLAISTIYLNTSSATGGPVHWHADFQMWNCGKEIILKSPSGMSNKTGTGTIHVHGDKRIHVEGILQDLKDASLSNIFKNIGGNMTNDRLIVPVDNGIVTMESGGTCPDGRAASLQFFVYQTNSTSFTQQKLTDPDSYIISKFPQVPPGDCVIVELDSPKEKTEHLCTSYSVAKETGKIHD